jgi:REP element-mobilizing transposase RayT
MARPLRPLIEGGIYHVYNRGNALQSIFERPNQRAEFLRLLERVCERCRWQCLSYCLMGNHYHLLVRTPAPNLSDGMRELGSSYAQTFNRARERPGPVFQGRFKCKVVQHDAHYLATLRYLALNPVAADLCTEPEQWGWSAHRALIGVAAPGIVAVTHALALLDEDLDRARAIYAASVADRADIGLPDARGGVVVGGREFAVFAVATASTSAEVPRRQRMAGRPALEELFTSDRDDALLASYVDCGYSQREIADHLDCHYSTVSRRIKAARMRQRKT